MVVPGGATTRKPRVKCLLVGRRTALRHHRTRLTAKTQSILLWNTDSWTTDLGWAEMFINAAMHMERRALAAKKKYFFFNSRVDELKRNTFFPRLASH